MGQAVSRLTTSDTAWIASNHPSLIVLEHPRYSLVEGKLRFNRIYDGIAIEDSYAIRLELSAESEALPRLTETDGRLRRVLAAHPEFKNKLVELHEYPDGHLCLGAPQDLRLKYLPNPSAKLLFERYIIPYFYSQSYFEHFGRWPWAHLPHDAKGLIDWYSENISVHGAARQTIIELRRLAANGNPQAKRIISRAMAYDSFSPNSRCLCGSGKRQASCHVAFMSLALAFRVF